MKRSENEIVAAPPFSTVQVKPPRFFARMVSSPFSRNTPFQLPTIRFSAFAAMLLWNRLLLARATATSRSASTETRRTAFFFFGFLPLAGMGASSAGVISAGAESASGAAVSIFSPQFIQKTASSGIGLPYLGQNGQVAGRRGTQIFLKRTIVFALLDGVLLAFDLRELVYRAADDQQSSGDTNDEQGVSLRNFWRGGR